MFKLYPWLNQPYQQLVEPLLQKRAHHAVLINYVQGSGERFLIGQFINRLLCETDLGLEPCGVCHGCRLFVSQHHPDCYVIEQENNKQSIGVDQIRRVANKVYEKSQQGGNKVIWVDQASLMTESAANALLKTLEEPPQNTYFILCDAHNTKQLPTIRSRCRYQFLPVPELDTSIAWLKQYLATATIDYPLYNENELATALLLNELAPLSALAMLEPKKWQQRQIFCQKLLIALPNHDYWSLYDEFNQEQVIERINWFCALLSDALKARQKAGKFIVNRDQVPLVRLLLAQGNHEIIRLHDLWLSARTTLLTVTGVNQALIVSNLLAQSEVKG